MGRLVRLPKYSEFDSAIAGSGNVLATTPNAPQRLPSAGPDNYLERVGKYFPGEVLGFFLVLNAILAQAVKVGGAAATMAAGLPLIFVAYGVVIAGIILTPLFVWYVHEEGDAWQLNAAVSTALFPFWAYALGAVAFGEYWDGNLAVIMLAIATAVSGLISPPPVARLIPLDAPAAALLPSNPPPNAPPPGAPPPGAPPRTDRPRLDVISTTPWS